MDDYVKTQQHTSTHRKRWIVNTVLYLKHSLKIFILTPLHLGINFKAT